MKINFNRGSEEVLSTTPLQEQEVSVSLVDQDKILYMLSQGNYKEPINSTIRELVSNAIDAQIEAGVDCIENPVIVGTNNKIFYVKDKGVGIDEERMSIIAKLGASTKDNREDQIGFFGIGFYAVHSYTESFMVESVKDKIKRTWIVGKNGIKKVITLTNTLETNEENGTTIIVPLKGYDSSSFDRAIMETLLYFKGVIVANNDEFNNKKIVEGEHYIFRQGTVVANDLHVVLDQVLYKIRPSDVGLTHGFPVALKFNISDGLIPTPSRENIILDDTTKQSIVNKVEAAFNELEPCIKSLIPNDDLIKNLHNSRANININLLEHSVIFDRTAYDHYCELYNKPVCYGFKPIDPTHFVLDITKNTYDLLAQINNNFTYICNFKWNGRFSKSERNYTIPETGVVLVDIKFSTKWVDFFRSKNAKNITFLKYSPFNSLRKYRRRDFLNLDKYDKKLWRNIIIAWQKEEERCVNNMTKLSSYQKEFDDWCAKLPKKSYTSKALGEKQNNEITIHLPKILERYSDRYNMKFVSEYLQLEGLKTLHIYSTNRDEVDKLYDLWATNPNIVPCMLNKTEVHKVEGKKNFIDYSTFLEGKNKYVQKWVTAKYIVDQIDKDDTLSTFFIRSYSGFKKHAETYPARLSTIKYIGVTENIDNIIAYLNKWAKYNNDNTIMQKVIDVFIQKDLLDKPVLSEWEYIKSKLKDYNRIASLSLTQSEHTKLINELVILRKKTRLLKNQLNSCKNDKC